MDDIIGDLEREDARVYDIRKHPDYRCYFPPSIQIGEDEYRGDSDYDAMIGTILDRPASEAPDDDVDEELIKLLEEAAAAQTLEEQNAIGDNVCWLCTHHVDQRSWWRKMFLATDEMSYLCSATKRTEVADPVSGRVKWIERTRGVIGPELALVNTPHPSCVELNPDGKCQEFDLALVERKKHRKE